MVALFSVLFAILWLTFISNVIYLHQRRNLAALPSTPPAVSVLIPARNEHQNLKRLLPSLLKQTYPAFEVILYDDQSTDGTQSYLKSVIDPRLHVYEGHTPPEGWLGKVYALFRASRHASGELYLFLDADTELTDENALSRIVQRHANIHKPGVLTGLPRLSGGAKLVVSLVPNAILAALPWMLVRHFPLDTLAALNGQCWMIDASTYHRLEPHRANKSEILEDVEIGKYLKRNGIVPELVDLQREIHVYMYKSFRDAWLGFRKNAYLIMGGRLATFIPLFILFALIFLIAPYTHAGLFAAFIGLKLATDFRAGIPIWISILAPISYLAAVIIQLDSAWHHCAGDVTWKGRIVSK